jgi:hypothetical protein
VRDKKVKRRLQKYSDEFVEPYKERLSAPAHGRVARHVATARAAARLAIEYGVLPWNLRNTDRDLAACLFAALKWMSDDSSDANMPTDEELVTSF